jgi:DNA-binding response OmpR family regulator
MMTAMDGRPRLLVVEDDAALRSSLLSALSQQDFEVRAQADGATFAEVVHSFRPDLALLDVSLPGDADGFDLAATLATSTSVPFLFITAADALPDRLRGFELGADDYLVKPFSMNELVARVAAAARRGTRAQEPRRGEEIVVEELRLDPRNVQAYVDGDSANLTPTEFRLLYTLALEQGRVLTRDELLQRVWGRRASHRDRTVDVFVRKLREKIDSRAPRHTFLQTRYGVGYKLEPELKRPAQSPT